MTRFKIGDTVHTMQGNRPHSFEVKAILIRGEGYQTSYYEEKNPSDRNKGFNESYCYASKEELKNTIFRD